MNSTNLNPRNSSKSKFSLSSSNIFAASNVIGQPISTEMELTEINIEPRTLRSETNHGLTVQDAPSSVSPTTPIGLSQSSNQINHNLAGSNYNSNPTNESIEMDLNEVDNIFETLTSSDFEMHNDTFIMSLLNDADLLRD